MDCKVQTVETVARMRIERVVNRYRSSMIEAEFYHVRDGGNWLAAKAWIPQGEIKWPMVQARQNALLPSEAAVVQVALQMAVEWVAEEMGRV